MATMFMVMCKPVYLYRGQQMKSGTVQDFKLYFEWLK